MRIFVLGTGATGSLLAQLLERQGHTVWCGDRDPERARRFLGKKSLIPIAEVNARNLRGIIRAARNVGLSLDEVTAALATLPVTFLAELGFAVDDGDYLDSFAAGV